MDYNVSVDALVLVTANSSEEAIEKVKDMFESGELSYEQLCFSIDNVYEEDE